MTDQAASVPVRTTHGDVLLASAGERGVLCDFYGEDASEIYRDLLDDDSWEARLYATHIRSVPGPVLELAAGTGRLTFPLLELGRDLTALELSATMLGILRSRLDAAPASHRDRCTVVQGDMSAFALDGRFGTVVLSPGSINLLGDVERQGLYASVRAQLEPGGQFLLGVPEKDVVGSKTLERSQELPGGSGRRYVLHMRLIPAEETREITIYPAEETADPFVVCTSRVKVRSADLIARELADAGFDILARTPLALDGMPHQDVLLVATPTASRG